MARPISPSQLIARLWSGIMHRYTGELLVLAPALLSVGGFVALYAFIVKWSIGGLEAGDPSVVWWAPAAVVAATVGRALAMWAQGVLSQDLGQKVLRDIQSAMFSKIIRTDFARLSQANSGSYVSRLTNDIGVISESLVRTLQAGLRDGIAIVGAVAAMLWMDWVLTLVIAALFLLTAPILSGIAKRARAQTEAQQTMFGRLVSHLAEVLSSPRLVKTYGLEELQDQRAHAGFEERRRMAMKLVHNRSRVDPLLEIVGGLSLAALFLTAGLRIASGATDLQSVLGMIAAVAGASSSARALGSFNTIFNEGLAALQRVYDLMDEPDLVVDLPGAKPLKIEAAQVLFENVSFAYGDAPALKRVNFAVSAGETVAVVGLSGAGKTTVFNLIPRLFDPTSGRVLIDGQDIKGVTIESLRRSIALVSQDVILFDDTIAANIAMGRPGATQQEIEEAARQAAAHDFILRQPQGYATRVGERGGLLSGGERQRISLARAFLRDAPILLLDEATSALDASSEAQVQEALARLAAGRTTLVIAHRLSTVRHATRILVMDQGEIVESGPHDELMARGGAYARLARLQFERTQGAA